jgi:uncharacterized protein YegP (UPF0339 family)
MQVEVFRNNGGQFHWRLVADDGITLAVSAAAFTSEPTAQASADAIRAQTTAIPEPVP